MSIGAVRVAETGVVAMAETGMVDAGAVRVAETGTVAVAEIGMADVGAVGMAETGAVDMAGEVAIGIPVSTATSDSLKVSTMRRMNILSKGKLQQEGDTSIYMKKR